MARERLYLFDTTLRDGAQTNGVDFTLDDKVAIAQMLDGLGIDYVEGGYPGANPTDTDLFATDRGLDTKFTAFGMTRRPGRSASNDPGLAALLGESRRDLLRCQELGLSRPGRARDHQ
jgi:2-isopropylmalate synthase